jgi:hypothetical protein
MLSVLLVLAAAGLFFGVDASKLTALAKTASEKVDAKKAIAAGLVVLALLLMPSARRPDEPVPVPDAGPLVLKGMFSGPTASDDAAMVGALCYELADEIEYDGQQPQPYLKTGVAVDELRRAARSLRCKGASIGDRQPAARDAIAAYLDENVGTDGGALTPESRAAWVSAYRDIGRAASDAAR